MGDMLQHSKNSVESFGGVPSDYFAIHRILDSSKLYIADWRHRALLHNTFGVHLLEEHIIGPTFKRESDGVELCTRTVATQHIIEDLGVLLTPGEFLREMPIRGWMSKVDIKTRARAQRMSIAGSTEPSNIDETITWYKYTDNKPTQDGMYLVRVYRGGTRFTAMWQFDLATDRWQNQVTYWANPPLGPDSN